MGLCFAILSPSKKDAAEDKDKSETESLGFPESDDDQDSERNFLQKTLDEAAGDRMVFIKFHDSCQTCSLMSKPYEELSKEFQNVGTFLEASLEDNLSSAKELEIKYLPTFVAFKCHQEVGRHVGVKADGLKQFIVDLLNT